MAALLETSPNDKVCALEIGGLRHHRVVVARGVAITIAVIGWCCEQSGRSFDTDGEIGATDSRGPTVSQLLEESGAGDHVTGHSSPPEFWVQVTRGSCQPRPSSLVGGAERHQRERPIRQARSRSRLLDQGARHQSSQGVAHQVKVLLGAVSSSRQELSNRWVYDSVGNLESSLRGARLPVQEQRVEAFPFENDRGAPPVFRPSREAVDEDHWNHFGARQLFGHRDRRETNRSQKAKQQDDRQ